MKAGYSDYTDQDFLNSMVNSINQYRAKHGAPPVELDQGLVDYAKSRAEHIADKGTLVHDGTAGYGENLYSSSSSEPVRGPATAASEAWYAEIKDYNYETFASNDPAKAIGHFTQLVWKASTRIGAGRVCGSADNTWHDTYVAVNFSTAGNLAGAYKENVLPPTA
ncbi:CAP family protein [Amycolatopsis sp. NPDC026612]|uniref:CAP family protein n=1 Tax=Amycolatopsis sp. NPDC026612 TaxID=3155466 RepID=UPI0033DBC2C7